MVNLRRLPTWRKRFVTEVERWRFRPFSWGDGDCVAFASACILAITGQDIAGHFAHEYSDPDGALEILGKGQWEGLGAAVAHFLPSIPAARGRAGDLALIPPVSPTNALPVALGVVNGATILVRAPDGLAPVPFSHAIRCFKVGD